MRLTHVIKYYFPFEYWVLTSDIQGELTYQLSYEAKGLMTAGGGGGLFLYTKEQMQIPMQVRNIRDASGNVVTQAGGSEYPMYVHAAEPQLDPFGTVVAWRHTLRREPPRDFTDLLDAALERVGE